MKPLDINGILREVKIFTDGEIDDLFRDNSLVLDPVAVKLNSDIDGLRQQINFETKNNNTEYVRRLAQDLDTLTGRMANYMDSKNKEFARTIVSRLLQKGTDLDVLYAYFLGWASVRNNTNLSSRRRSMTSFAYGYALPYVRAMQDKIK